MKTNVVNYTPIPAQVSRALAIDILHSHGEIITLNPLVIGYQPMKAPRDAPSDEFYSTWYEITQRIKIVPGMGSVGTSKVTFKGVFHDMPWGIQTHMYVPLGIDLKHKWQVRGNQLDEPHEPRELGSGAPPTGLYLQENVEITCNALAISFVKKELKAASKVMIERMMKKAELIDSGAMQARFEDGKLKTVNPMDRTSIYSMDPTQFRTEQRRSSHGEMTTSSRDSQHRSSTAPHATPYGVPNSHGSDLAIEMLGDTHYSAGPSIQSPRTSNRPEHHAELAGDSPVSSDVNRRYSFVSSSDVISRSSDQSPPSSYHMSPAINQPYAGSNINASLAPISYDSAQSPGQHQNVPSPWRSLSDRGQNSPVPSPQKYNPQDYANFSGPHRS